MPSGRLRVAELAGSMVWAAPWAALLSLLTGALFGVDLSRRPQDLGFLFAMTLLGSWSVLAANKFAEGRTIDATTRRVLQLVLGAGLGLFGSVLAGWMLVDPASTDNFLVHFRLMNFNVEGMSSPGILGYAAYFGLVGLAVDWWTMTDRDRKARFRIVPMAKAALFAAIPGILFFSPNQHPWAIPVVVLTTAVVQLSSPWSEPAAKYARYLRSSDRGNRARLA